MINICTKFEFNPSTSWGSYARHRHNLLHGARSTTDIKPWHKHTTGELKILMLVLLANPTLSTVNAEYTIHAEHIDLPADLSLTLFLLLINSVILNDMSR